VAVVRLTEPALREISRHKRKIRPYGQIFSNRQIEEALRPWTAGSVAPVVSSYC
jgi:hypothetical protein